MATGEVMDVLEGVPFGIDRQALQEDTPGFHFGLLLWQPGSNGQIPTWWSPARDTWLRSFVGNNGPLKAVANTFINKIVTVPWSVNAHDRSIARHVRRAAEMEKNFRRNSGSMSSSPIKGFKAAFKMFWQDYLTQDNGAFMAVLGDGEADGPILGAPYGVLHLDSALCTRTADPEYPVKYLNRGTGRDNAWYKLHYTRVIEMSNMPSADVNMNGVGYSAVSCCLEAAQELWDIYKYSSEMFGSRPPRQILYAEEGATVSTLKQAVQHWQLELDNENRARFGGTMLAAPGKSGAKLVLKILNLSQMPENFNRRDATTINMSGLAAAFGLDLRDVAYTLGAPSRTGDAEVQDRKGRGKGIGEALETFAERFNEICLGEPWYINFDYLDDEQDEQAANIRSTRSEARQRDLMGGITTIRYEREQMLDNGEISQENFDDMELADGRLPDGLDVLLLFQSNEEDFQEWLDLGVADPTDVSANPADKMVKTIHAQQILVSEYIHVQTRPDLRRQARQALAALEKLRLMYEAKIEAELQAEIAQQQIDAQQANRVATGKAKPTSAATPNPTARPGMSPTGKEGGPPASTAVQPGRMVNGADLTKEVSDYDNILDEYGTKFRMLVDQAAQGELNRERFEEVLGEVVFGALLALFLRGAHMAEGQVGQDMWETLANEAQPHFNSLMGLTEDVYGGRYEANLQAAYGRIDGWLNIASGFYYLGQTFRVDDPMLRWVYSAVKEHCKDCARLDGQVHPASEWRARGWVPRRWNLECHGIHCGCMFEQVEAPARGGF